MIWIMAKVLLEMSPETQWDDKIKLDENAKTSTRLQERNNKT